MAERVRVTYELTLASGHRIRHVVLADNEEEADRRSAAIVQKLNEGATRFRMRGNVGPLMVRPGAPL